MKNYNQAPLPFMGQKRRFLPDFREGLKLFSDCPIFVDLFGGSGLLSHTIKQERPEARVIYNDFDDYHVRLANIIRTNALLSDLRLLVANEPKDKLIKADVKAAILHRIKQDEKTGFVDYITLSSSLLFSMNYANNFHEFEKQSFYNTVRQNDYDCSEYLQEVEIVKKDYKELFEQYRHHPSVVFIIDPPYLSTEAGTYTGYWKLADYLDV